MGRGHFWAIRGLRRLAVPAPSTYTRAAVPRVHALLVLRVAALVAMAASAALAIEYRSFEPSFCGVDSGCAALRQTDLAYLWGLLPLPDVGLLGAAAIFGLSLTRARALSGWLALGAAVTGLGLLAYQSFVIGRFCWLCITVDLASIAMGVGGGMLALGSRAQRSADPASERSRLSVWAWGALGVLAIVAPVLWPSAKPNLPVPEVIRAHYAPGKINVVEFADFECPFCRALHHRLKDLLEPYGDRINFVRLNLPLDRHPHAHGAALAAICAEPSGKAGALSEFLFTTEDLSPQSIQEEAERLGIPGKEFEACVKSAETEKRLARESQILRDIGFEGLPTTYIASERIVGAQSDETFQDALVRAAEGGGKRGVPGWAYLLIVAVIAGAVVRTGWTPGEKAASARS